MFSSALKNLDFYRSTFIPGLLLYYIAIFKGDIFFPPWQLANNELIGERNSKSHILDLSGLCSQHSIYIFSYFPQSNTPLGSLIPYLVNTLNQYNFHTFC